METTEDEEDPQQESWRFLEFPSLPGAFLVLSYKIRWWDTRLMKLSLTFWFFSQLVLWQRDNIHKDMISLLIFFQLIKLFCIFWHSISLLKDFFFKLIFTCEFLLVCSYNCFKCSNKASAVVDASVPLVVDASVPLATVSHAVLGECHITCWKIVS